MQCQTRAFIYSKADGVSNEKHAQLHHARLNALFISGISAQFSAPIACHHAFVPTWHDAVFMQLWGPYTGFRRLQNGYGLQD